ncbi:MAG: prolyl oligopeptidase family serine peptidase [Gemmatimonadaceae bacterium]
MMHFVRPLLGLLACLLLGTLPMGSQTPSPHTVAATLPAVAQLAYPQARISDHADTYFGIRVSDPYRWLEDLHSPETRQWVEAENALTFGYLTTIAERAGLRERLTALWDYPKYDAPTVEDGKLFYFANAGLQNQAALYVKESERDPARLLLDPNTLATGDTVAIASATPSPNARYLAYGVATSGSDWQEIRVRDVRSGRDLADTVKWVKFSRAAWTQDNRGFFYARYEEPKPGTSMSAVNRGQKLYYHRIGRSQREDDVVYERPDHPDWLYDAKVTDDGQYLVITISQGSDERTRLYYKDLDDPDHPVVDAPAIKLFDDFDASYRFIDNLRSTFVVETNRDASRGRVLAVNSERSRESEWRTLVAEGRDPIAGVALIGGNLIVSYWYDAHSLLRVFALNGETRGDIALPGIGTVGPIRARRMDRVAFFTFTSYLAPTAVYRYDAATRAVTVWNAPTIPFDVTAYETRQLFVTSKDGTRVPLFLTAKKGVALDGNNPTLLSAYGGFNVSMSPSFTPATLVWLERGGIYVEANLRGGGEYGRAWHESGMREKKQNVFDDCIAVAEFLVREKYTRPGRLAIKGASNGGLLVGAVMTQRPDLFGAALPAVGVMDMLRFQKFTIGWAWAAEYGSSDDSTGFRTLYAYSPLQNIRKGTRYPATLITTADHDDRVVPGHSFKFAAALQAAQVPSGPPVLIRIATTAGYGGGKPTSKRIDEAVDELGFLIRNLAMGPAM